MGSIGEWLRRRPWGQVDRTAAARSLGRATIVAAVLLAAGRLLLDAIPAMVAGSATRPWDGIIDWGGAREMLAGRDPYSPESLAAIGLSPERGLGHPPTTLIWFYPLAGLDLEMMKHVATGLTLVMLLFHVGIVAAELELPAWPLVALLISSAVYGTDWFLLHLSLVDLSELIALLYVLCWYFLRRGRDGPAGVMVGLACTLKLYPGLMVLFLGAARRWRAVIAAALTYAVFGVEVLRRLGPAGFRHFLEQTGGYTDGWIADIRNASLTGIVHRLFFPLWGWERRALTAASVIAAAVSLALLALAWLVSARRIRAARSEPAAIDLPFALFSVLSMAPGPYQWEHYNVTLILPFLMLASEMLRAERTGPRWWIRPAALAAVLAAVALLLDVDFARRVQVGASARSARVSMGTVLFYEISAWLPWVMLSVTLALVMYLDDRRARTRARANTLVPAPG
jgi:hypothetical protein